MAALPCNAQATRNSGGNGGGGGGGGGSGRIM